MGPIRILIGEDHLIARVGLAAILNAQPDMTVVGEGLNGEQIVALYREHQPDVTLMDIRMPVMNGFEAITAIRAEFPDASIVAVSTFGGDADVRKALYAGALAFLTKDAPQDELLQAIRVASEKKKYITPLVVAALEAEARGPDLSNRELEVLELLARGMSNKQIAHELRVADDTAKNHIKSILRKLGAQDRTQAATEAIQRGIIHLQW
ncbi:MAG: response regulator transcription factor [Bryobacteraceae bacterium]